MDAERPPQYAAFDHTDLERRRKKLWNLADGVPLTVIGGLDLRALVVAMVVFLGSMAIVFTLAPLPFIALNLWSILGCLVMSITFYALWPRRWRNGLTTEQNLLVAADYLFLQPRRIHGLAADVEPEAVHWRVILWQPYGPRWRASLSRARSRRSGLWRSHPDDGLHEGKGAA